MSKSASSEKVLKQAIQDVNTALDSMRQKIDGLLKKQISESMSNYNTLQLLNNESRQLIDEGNIFLSLKIIRDQGEHLEPEQRRQVVTFAAIEALAHTKLDSKSDNISEARMKCIQELFALSAEKTVADEDLPTEVIKILKNNGVHLTEPDLFQRIYRFLANLPLLPILVMPILGANFFMMAAESRADTADQKLIENAQKHAPPRIK